MASLAPSPLQLAAALALVAAGAASSGVRGDSGPLTERPKVEFVEVKGLPCLWPVVNTADAELSDFRSAELRWVGMKYPGSNVPKWETELILPPGPATRGELDGVTVQRETLYVQRDDGSTVTVCFDINPTQVEKVKRELARMRSFLFRLWRRLF